MLIPLRRCNITLKNHWAWPYPFALTQPTLGKNVNKHFTLKGQC